MTRVQVRNLPDAPQLQTTVQSGGNYGIAVQQVGRNKLMDLADALSTVNPMLKDYSIATKLRKDALMEQGRTQFATDPSEVSKQLTHLKGLQDITSKKVRKLVEQGLLPDNANPIRMLGALQAQSEVLVKRDYRAELMNAETLLQTTDPEAEILRQREAFLERGEFSSAIVKKHALDHMATVEQEFRGTVQKRLSDREISQGQENWANLGRDSIEHVINGVIDINDQSIKDWLNHPASLFKGSRQYAWNNMIREELLEGLTTPTLNPDGSLTTKYTPSQVQNFLTELRDLDLGNGVKFADHTTGTSISEFSRTVDAMAATIENQNAAAINRSTSNIVGASVKVFTEELRANQSVSLETFNRELAKINTSVPLHKQEDAVSQLTARFKGLNGVVADDDTQSLIFSDLNMSIEDGSDLDKTKEDIEQAFKSQAITIDKYDTLNRRLEDSREFTKVVLGDPSFKRTEEGYEDIILGFKKSKSLFDFAAVGESGFFSDYNKDEVGENSLYSKIKNQNKLGDTGAKHFVNQRYEAFQLELKRDLKREYERLEEDASISPKEALTRIQSEMAQIAESAYQSWQIDTVSEANKLFALNVPTPTFK